MSKIMRKLTLGEITYDVGVPVVDSCTSTSADSALSANQGSVLMKMITDLAENPPKGDPGVGVIDVSIAEV